MSCPHCGLPSSAEGVPCKRPECREAQTWRARWPVDKTSGYKERAPERDTGPDTPHPGITHDKRNGESNRRPRCGRCKKRPLYLLVSPLTATKEDERIATYRCPDCGAQLCRKEWRCVGCGRWVVDPLFHHTGE